MLNNWFILSKAREGMAFASSDLQAFGNSLKNLSDFTAHPNSAQLALIGYEPTAADAIRSQLYPLSMPWNDLPMVDLGNLRKTDDNFAIQALKAVLGHGLIRIVIGGPDLLLHTAYESFQEFEKRINLALIQDRLDQWMRTDYWREVCSGIQGHLHQFCIIGHQSHFLSRDDNQFLNQWALEELRLGDLHQLPGNMEPCVRNADLIVMDMNAIRYSDAPGQSRPNPNGLSGEEFCQLARYAGISEKSRAIAFHGFSYSTDPASQTAQLLAQAIWYFTDGVINRKSDYPISSRHLTEYVVDLKDMDEQLRFWKSGLTGRWWVQLPAEDNGDTVNSEMIPCLFEDYQMASNEEISDRIFRALRRLV